MNDSAFNNMAKQLQDEIAKEIAYTYSVFIPYDTKRVISAMKKNILLSDRKFLDETLQSESNRNLIFPYDVLSVKLEKLINDFYDEIGLSGSTLSELTRYGERGDVFKRSFDESVNKAKEKTVETVLYELNMKMMQNKDAKATIAHMNIVLSKQMKSLRNLLKQNYRQMRQYMVLWDYQDKGYKYYRIRTNGDNCEDCTSLEKHNKLFLISEAESGKNFIPLHPNCDCIVEIVDNQGKTVFVMEKPDVEQEATSELEYLKTSLKQVLLGNYTEDVNLLGTLGQIALGLSGIDIFADVRDVIYDLTNWENTSEHKMQTFMDAAAFLPLIGGAKYIDEAGDLAKATLKNGDEVVKNTTNITYTISNLGKRINIMISKKHFVVSKNPGYKGIPNSSIDIIDETGTIITRRWYDSYGKAYRDVDFTNHGNQTTHPEWPHEHLWKYDIESGKPISR